MLRTRNGRVRWTRLAALLTVLLAALTVGGREASASGVDSAGRVVIVPLVVNGLERASRITITNPWSQPLRVEGIYVGAEGTPHAASKVGPLNCPPQSLLPEGSLTLDLFQLCGLSTPDVEDVGYLELSSNADSRFTFFATSVVETNRGTTFAIAGQPIGAYDVGDWRTAPLGGSSGKVLGLRTVAPPPTPSPLPERLACWIASLGEPKQMNIELRDASGVTLGARSPSLAARRMVRLDAVADFKVPAQARENLRVEVDSIDGAQAVVGCGMERGDTLTVAYQPVQTPAPMDRARLRSVDVDQRLQPGPYTIGYLWNHSLAGDAYNLKVMLSTYLRWDDSVRCFLTPSATQPGFDPTPWLELQVRAPDGQVFAGGNGVKDTGVFQTGPQGKHAAKFGQRWQIEISFDEDAYWRGIYPSARQHGVWGLHCQSAAGMSEPLPVNTVLRYDDF